MFLIISFLAISIGISCLFFMKDDLRKGIIMLVCVLIAFITPMIQLCILHGEEQKEVFQKGYEASSLGISAEANPHEGSLGEIWLDGHMKYTKENQ